MTYQIVLALHIICIISWMAGILYLYRLLVYASEQGFLDSKIHQLLALMSHRLSKYIALPAMTLSWIAGFSLLAMNPALAAGGWFHMKFAAIIALSGSTLHADKLARRYRLKTRPLPSSKQLRFLNEVPTLLMILIVFLVVLKPF